jgi:hypothetical protein
MVKMQRVSSGRSVSKERRQLVGLGFWGIVTLTTPSVETAAFLRTPPMMSFLLLTRRTILQTGMYTL